jgi:hypothetical protein
MQRIKQVLVLIIVFACFGMSSKKDNTVLYEGLLYTDQSPVRIEVTNGKISAIKKISGSSAKDLKLFIAPGLIDNQVNGYAGVTFSQGDAVFTEEDVLKVTRALWKEGVTTFLPTLRTNDQQYLIRNLKVPLQDFISKVHTFQKKMVTGGHMRLSMCVMPIPHHLWNCMMPLGKIFCRLHSHRKHRVLWNL